MSSDIRSLEFLPVTKVLLIGLGVVTLPCLVGLMSTELIYLHWPSVRNKCQIWRPLTAFFFGGGGFPLIMDTFCLYQTSTALEQAAFGDTASYVWTNLVLASLLLVCNAVSLRRPFLFKPYLSALLYIWARTNPTMNISLFGLVRVPARLYPPVLVFLDLVQNGPGGALGCVMGILVGHLWWFLSYYLPLEAPTHLRRPNPLAMPAWFRRRFTTRAVSSGTFSSSGRTAGLATGVQATRQRDANAAAEVRHRWGSGQKLGGSSL